MWERRLYLARRVIERRAARAGIELFVCSLSCRTVVYKALLVGTELPGFYARSSGIPSGASGSASG